MAASIAVEEEHGTYTRTWHTHNGYYAGDFPQYDEKRPAPTYQPFDHGRS